MTNNIIIIFFNLLKICYFIQAMNFLRRPQQTSQDGIWPNVWGVR